jgi:hypothetical protein
MSWKNDERGCEIYDALGNLVGALSVYDDDRDLAVFLRGSDETIGLCYTAFSSVEELSGMTPVQSGGLVCQPINNPPQARLDLAFERVRTEALALGYTVKSTD